jgi:hypothetical protein
MLFYVPLSSQNLLYTTLTLRNICTCEVICLHFMRMNMSQSRTPFPSSTSQKRVSSVAILSATQVVATKEPYAKVGS